MWTILLRILHLCAVAVWVGYPLGASGDIRRSLFLGPPHTEYLVNRIDRAVRIVIGSGILTVLTGLGLVFAQGGFGAVPVRIHIGMTIAILLLALGATVTQPAWVKIRKVILSKGDLEEARPASRRFSMADGIEQTLKLAALALMAWRS